MAGWWEGLSPWDQGAYFVAGLVAVYLISVVQWPWNWLAKLPPGSGRQSDSEAADIDLTDGMDAGSPSDPGGWPDFGGFPDSDGGHSGSHSQ